MPKALTVLLLIACVALTCGARAEEKPKPAEADKTPAPAPAPAKPDADADEPHKKITKEQINAVTFEECEDDMGVTFPFFPDFDRVGDNEDRKKSFDEWKDKVEKWEGKPEDKTVQKVRNYISLMALVDVLQMEWEGETPKILYERMVKEFDKDELIKAATYIILKPDEGTVIDKAPTLDIEDGAAEDRVRERLPVYAKKVLGRLLGKLPPKDEEAAKKEAQKK